MESNWKTNVWSLNGLKVVEIVETTVTMDVSSVVKKVIGLEIVEKLWMVVEVVTEGI